MGLDLTLIPVDHDQADWGFGHSLIEFGGARDVYERIGKLVELPIPKDFATFKGRGKDGEHGYGNTQQTSYGEQMRSVAAGALADALEPGQSKRQKAAIAYLRALDSDHRVALYWH